MCDVVTLIIYISNKLKYLKNKAKKQKSAKEVTLVLKLPSNKADLIFVSYTL